MHAEGGYSGERPCPASSVPCEQWRCWAGKGARCTPHARETPRPPRRRRVPPSPAHHLSPWCASSANEALLRMSAGPRGLVGHRGSAPTGGARSRGSSRRARPSPPLVRVRSAMSASRRHSTSSCRRVSFPDPSANEETAPPPACIAKRVAENARERPAAVLALTVALVAV